MTETYVKDGIEYTVSNHRIRYNPEFHNNHYKAWTTNDIIYLCGMWRDSSMRDISLALGRTEGTCSAMIYRLKKRGEFDRYRKMFEEQ